MPKLNRIQVTVFPPDSMFEQNVRSSSLPGAEPPGEDAVSQSPQVDALGRDGRPRAASICKNVHTLKKTLFLWKALFAPIPDEAEGGPGVHGCHPLRVWVTGKLGSQGRGWFKTLKK